MVNSNIETLDDNKVKMSVMVDETVLDEAIEVAFKKIAKQVRLPGFRPGKAPRKLVESHYGKDMLRGQAIEENLDEYIVQGAAAHELDYIALHDLDIAEGSETGPLNFDVVLELRPRVNIGGYQNLRVEIPSPHVTPDEIDEQVDQIRAQFGELEVVERAAGTGDRVTIDIAGELDGEAVDGLTASDYLYEVGSGFVVSELDENLDGVSAGDTVSFDADHPDPEVDGELSFTIDIKDVQEMKLPELTDEFVGDATEFETIDEFRADVEARLEATKLQTANAALQEKAGEALGQLVSDDMPDPLVDAEINQRINDLAYRMQSQGMDFEQYLQLTGSSIDEMREQMREPAIDAVRIDLALRAVATAEGLDPDDAEIDEEFENLAGQMGGDAAALKARLQSANQMVSLRGDMAKRKAGEWIFEHLEIVDPDGNLIDRADLESPEDEPDPDDPSAAADQKDEEE